MQPFDLDLCVKMWKNGASASQIAKAIGSTRNSVMGHIHRKRDLFERRGSPIITKEIRKPVSHEKRTEYDSSRIEFAKTLVDLERGECKWPLTERGPHLFCAAETKTNYCSHHTARYYRCDAH